MSLHVYSIIVFFSQFLGYIGFSSVLQYFYYYRQSTNKFEWKIQPASTTGVGVSWTHPIVLSKPERGPYHALFTTFNLLVASCCASFTTELSLREINYMRFEVINLYSFQDIYKIMLETVIIVTYQCVAEYYWHRLMHIPYFYKNFHKYHHFYKSPEPWDDMYIHPIEAFGYYCILFGPPFIFSIHYFSFIIYMIIMGVCGMLDHSGIKFELWGLYNTADHDYHHSKFEVNYSFPFPYMDILHGTFYGTYCGFEVKSKRTKS